jgi:hypothetical protein
MSDAQEQEKDIAQGLSQLGETTTAAELLRQKGQTKKLRVISEKQLMTWILKLLQQHMAGKADVFSDIEKTEMLEKAQEEIRRRMKREQEAQSERDRMKAELEQAMAAISQAQAGSASQADMEMALGALKEKLEQAEQINLDLQQDNYDLQDQLNEKMALLGTTIAEKDKLRDTVRNQMMRMSSLCEGVLGIDNDYYGSRHQEENPVSDEASQDEQFYHDFDVGAKVITTLQADLERLRGMVRREEQQAVEQQEQKNLLAADLDLLEQLKAGNLHAVDVAAPVAGLIEALEGARLEGETFETQVAEATGARAQPLSDLPDSTGDPAEVLAGATSVVRELAACLARNRNRIAALKAIADESDEARHGTEDELEAARTALERVCTALRQRAESERVEVPPAVADREATPADRAAACAELVDRFQAASPVDGAAIEQLALTERLVRKSAPQPAVDSTDKELVAERLRKAGAELERYTIDLQQQLDAALARERDLVGRIAASAAAQDAEAPAAVRELERSIEVKADPQLVAGVAARAIEALAAGGGRKASIAAAFEEDKAIAAEIVRAAQGDKELAESVAGLAISAEETDATTQPQLAGELREAVAALGRRRAALESEVAELKAANAAIMADQGAGSAEAQRLAGEIEKARADQQRTANEILRLRSGRDAALVALNAIAADLYRRVPGADPDLTDASSEPEARARAAAAAIARLAEHRAAEQAAIEAVRGIDRALARSGESAHLAADLAPGDEDKVAERLQAATGALEQRIQAMAGDLDAARNRERDLARQIRELSAAQAVSAPAAAPREEIARVDRALSEQAAPADLAEATRKLIAGMKANAGKAEAEAKATALRGVAGELVRAAEGDAELADQAADLALAADNPESGSELESQTRAAIAKLAARKKAVEAERARLAADLARLEHQRAEKAAETGRFSSEAARLKMQNAALSAAVAQLTAEVAGRVQAAGKPVPAALTDPAAEPGARASAAVAAISRLSDAGRTSEAAVLAIQSTDRLIAATGGASGGLAEGLAPNDDEAVAERLARAQRSLDQHVAKLRSEADAARNTERDLAKQVRELAVAASVSGSPAVPREELARLERAIAEPASNDLAEASRRVIASLKSAASRAEQAGRSGAVRAIAADLVKAAEGDPSLADSAADLAVAIEGGEDAGIEARMGETVARIAARKRAAESDRARMAGEIEALRSERASLAARADAETSALRSEADQLQSEISRLREQLDEARADVDEHRARSEATGTQFSGELVAARSELSQLRVKQQEQQAQLAQLRQAAEAAEARLKRQREELNRGLAERDALIAEKDGIIDQLSNQRIDGKALQAKVQALGAELDAANERIRELEGRAGDSAGMAVRSGDLVELHKRTSVERDQLRQQKRAIEGDLAEARASLDQAQTELAELRKEHQSAVANAARELAKERENTVAMQEALRALKQEVIGLKARQRAKPEQR